MIRNLKVLGLALFAVMAVSAVVAGGASAAFKAESVPVTTKPIIESVQKFQYQAEGVTVSCSTVSGDATQSTTPTTEITSSVSYSNCSTSFGVAHVSMGSCDYLFTSATGSTVISSHLLCSAGGSVTITVTEVFGNSVCTIHLFPQTTTGTSGVNVGTGTTREVTIHNAVTGVVGTRTGSSLCGPESSSTGTYSGDITVTGENPTSHVHIGVFMD